MKSISNNSGIAIAVLCALIGTTGCESRQEKVSDAVSDGNKKIAAEQAEAAKEIGRAQLKLDQTARDAQDEMNTAREKLIKEQHEASKEIGKAQQKAAEDVQDAAQ